MAEPKRREDERNWPMGPVDEKMNEPLPDEELERDPSMEIWPPEDLIDDMNRPKTEEEFEQEELEARHRPDERSPLEEGEPGSAGGPVNMQDAGAGGTALGGLAGSNEGDGSPDYERLEELAGSSYFDEELEEQDEPPYAGRSGGAVGGTPAEKRASGGRIQGGIAPDPSERGDSTIGSDPRFQKDEPRPKSNKAKK